MREKGEERGEGEEKVREGGEKEGVRRGRTGEKRDEKEERGREERENKVGVKYLSSNSSPLTICSSASLLSKISTTSDLVLLATDILFCVQIN